ncbi:unnamed protein product [Periconia digitata]|uniref:Uncharacterized protein n=1 Tax=Periconia digitata TaxID=1303443 RepID=A0A9W4XRX2_9PLEO|nr:unnamed protein product [Periconia digitata]
MERGRCFCWPGGGRQVTNAGLAGAERESTRPAGVYTQTSCYSPLLRRRSSTILHHSTFASFIHTQLPFHNQHHIAFLSTLCTMASEAEIDPQQGQPYPPAVDAAPEPGADDQKAPVKRSWRRKYRKMRARFEETMNMSNALILGEWKAQALSRRLQEENDQLLDTLLTMNETARIPAPRRVDLRTLAETDPAIPTSLDPELIQHRLHELRSDLANGLITPESYAHLTEHLHNSQVAGSMLTLAKLESSVPHSTTPPHPPVDGVDLTETAPGYMSPNHEEEYLLSLDMAMANPNYKPESQDIRRTIPIQAPPSEKDLTIRNPNSVYNWLRKNQPQVFLQDKDQVNPENVPEKLPAKSANGGGRGKRQSAAHGTPAPKTEHEDEDGFVPETGTTAKPRKSKGGEEDGAYRPKGGSSRPSKRKREDGDAPTKGGRKKNRQSTSAVN